MPLMRLRVTGSDDDVRAISNLLTSLDGIEHIEEVDDLMPHMDDDDSSSAGLPDDQGPGQHALEIEAPNLATASARARRGRGAGLRPGRAGGVRHRGGLSRARRLLRAAP